NKPHPIEAQSLHVSFVGRTTGPEEQEQGGNEQGVDLDGDPIGGFSQPMLARQGGFEPFKKEFNLPAIAVNESNLVSRQVLAGCGEQKDFVQDTDFDHPQNGTSALASEFLNLIGDYAGLSILLGKRTGLTHGGANDIAQQANHKIKPLLLQLL